MYWLSGQGKKTTSAHSRPKRVVIGKKFPHKFDDRIVDYSQQTTIFHWNWKRYWGLLDLSLGSHSQFSPTNLNISFYFQWKQVFWEYNFWIHFQKSVENFFLSIQAQDNCDIHIRRKLIFLIHLHHSIFRLLRILRNRRNSEKYFEELKNYSLRLRSMEQLKKLC